MLQALNHDSAVALLRAHYRSDEARPLSVASMVVLRQPWSGNSFSATDAEWAAIPQHAAGRAAGYTGCVDVPARF
ncbi:hypothetical protein ACQEVZ_29935 [Dactylosporangium sp. CA-152071]|uniref:hypothetical protein n=1 Tax=Dactylosporangium sp. CA-152071 TaxID=3239933 RepID=UPI003D8AABCE